MSNLFDVLIFALAFGEPKPLHKAVFYNWSLLKRANFIVVTDMPAKWHEMIPPDAVNIQLKNESIDSYFSRFYPVLGCSSKDAFLNKYGKDFFGEVNGWTACGLRPLLKDAYLEFFAAPDCRYKFWGWIDYDVFINPYRVDVIVDCPEVRNFLLYPANKGVWEQFKLFHTKYDLKEEYLMQLDKHLQNAPMEAVFVYYLKAKYNPIDCRQEEICSHLAFSDKTINCENHFDVFLYPDGRIFAENNSEVLFFIADTEVKRWTQKEADDCFSGLGNNTKVYFKHEKILPEPYLMYRDNRDDFISLIVLNQNGSIENGSNNEHSWRRKDNELQFITKDNRVSTIFRDFDKNSEVIVGDYQFDFNGRNNLKHLLRPLGRKTGIWKGPLDSNFKHLSSDCHELTRLRKDFTIICGEEVRVDAKPDLIFFDNCRSLTARSTDITSHWYFAPKPFYHVLHNATLHNGGIVTTNEQVAIWETTYQAQLRSRYLPYSALENGESSIYLPLNTGTIEKQGTWFLFNTLLGNYAHFHIQSLCSVGMLSDCKNYFGADVGVICTDQPGIAPNKHFQLYRQESFIRFGIESAQMMNPLMEPSKSIRFERLIVPSSHIIPHGEKFHPYYVETLRKTLAQNSDLKKKDRRILLSRSDVVGKRDILNFDELEFALKVLGFETLTIGSLPYDQQMDVLTNAEIVVSSHGGNITNIISCQSGLKVFELTHSHQINAWFKNLAILSGHKYAIYCTDPIGNGWGASYKVNVERVVSAIIQFLSLSLK